MKLSQYISSKAFREEFALGKSESYVKQQRYNLASITMNIGQIDIALITPKVVADLYSKLKKSGLLQSTIAKYMSTLKEVFDVCLRDGLISKNPLSSAPKFCKGINHKRVIISRDEFRKLSEAITNDDIHDMFIVASETGLRQNNLLNLKWRDVDFPGMTISINGNDMKGSGRSDHVIPMSSAVLGVMRSRAKINQYVFPLGENYKPMNASTLRKKFKGFVDASGVGKVRWHDLRHYFVTECLRSGLGLHITKELAGHVNVQTTMRYAHSELSERVAAIDKAFG